MAKVKDYIPRNDAAFDQWFKNLTQYLAQKTSGAAKEWDHIPKDALDELIAAYADWFTFYAPTLKPHTRAETTEKDNARKRAEKIIRPFVKQYLHFKPVSDGDRNNMSIPNHGDVRSSLSDPAEYVEFSFRIAGIRRIKVHFKVLGAADRARPYGCNGALIRWLIGGKAASSMEELIKDDLATRTPYTLDFTDADRGKTVSVALCWQNERGRVGPWSEIQSTIVP